MKVTVFFLWYDEILLSSLLGDCYHYLVFMDLVNGYSKPNLFVKEQVSFKNKIRFSYVSPPVDGELK